MSFRDLLCKINETRKTPAYIGSSWNDAQALIFNILECELSFSTGTFLNNYDVMDRSLKPLVIYSTVGKREKREENAIVETTKDSRQFTSNDVIAGNGRILKFYMFIVQLYLFKEIYHVNVFFFFLLMHYIKEKR